MIAEHDDDGVHLDLQAINKARGIALPMAKSGVSEDDIGIELMKNGFSIRESILFLESDWIKVEFEPTMTLHELKSLHRLSKKFAKVFSDNIEEKFNDLINTYPELVEMEIDCYDVD